MTIEEVPLVEPLLLSAATLGRPRTTDLRSVFNAIQYLLVVGCQWRPSPRCWPPFTTVYFYERRVSGLFDEMQDAL